MADILNFRDALKRIKKGDKHYDLSDLLKKAVVLKKNLPEQTDGVNVVSFKKLRTIFEARISDILIHQRLINTGFFLCGTYIADLLTETVRKIPKSWFAIDYIIEGNEKESPRELKMGANLCFLLCTFFKERTEFRAMTYEDYEKMGIGLFHQFYGMTGKEIGYHMSSQYRVMVRVTDECIKTI